MAKYNATYTSVWDGGIRVNARCCANRKTKRISRIGKNDICPSLEEQLDVLDYEIITFDDTKEEYRAISGYELEELYGCCYDSDEKIMKEIKEDYGETFYIYYN